MSTNERHLFGIPHVKISHFVRNDTGLRSQHSALDAQHSGLM